MKGDGIRQKLKVTGSGPRAKRDPELDKAVADYREYAQEQADETLPKVETFADGDQGRRPRRPRRRPTPRRASAGSAPSRSPSPSGTSTPRSTPRRRPGDGPEVDRLAPRWRRRCGRTRRPAPAQKTLADRLVTDLKDWQKRVGKAVITPTSMANGAKELLDEVATGKVTGEEDRYSHTDLSDFKANVEGAEKAYELLKPVAQQNDTALTTELDKQFASLNTTLDKYRTDRDDNGFMSYDTVDQGPAQGALGRGRTRSRSRCPSSPPPCEVADGPHDRHPEATRRGSRRRQRPAGVRCSAGAVPGSRSVPPRPAARCAASPPTRRTRPPPDAARRSPSTASTRPASPRRCRTGCTSPRST